MGGKQNTNKQNPSGDRDTCNDWRHGEQPCYWQASPSLFSPVQMLGGQGLQEGLLTMVTAMCMVTATLTLARAETSLPPMLGGTASFSSLASNPCKLPTDELTGSGTSPFHWPCLTLLNLHPHPFSLLFSILVYCCTCTSPSLHLPRED